MSEEKEVYKMLGHVWYTNSHAGKQVCANCGLVYLHNPATEWCVQRGCLHSLHPAYKATMYRLTKLF